MTDQSPIPGQISSSEADELENEILSELNENKPSETEDVKEAESEVEDSLSLSEEQPTISVVPVELQNEEWDSKTNEEEEEKEDDEEEDLEDVIELDRPPSPTKSVLYPPVPEYVPPTQQFHQHPQQQQCQYQYQQQQPMGMVPSQNAVMVQQPAWSAVNMPPSQPVLFMQPQQPQRTKYGTKSMQVTCGNCRQLVQTKTSKNINSSGWILTGILCLVCPCCFWIPVVCIDNCQDTTHSCSNCKFVVGKHCA